ncbi:MAG: pilus assembly protein PilM [Thermodesulfobacteriota bacterium]
MTSTSSLGIYFEKSRIDLVCLRRSFRGFDINGHLSIDLDQSKEGPARHIQDFIRETRSENSEVYLGIPKQEVIAIHLNLPAPTEENLREVLGYELDRHTPYTAEEAYFDFQVTGRDEEKNTIKVLLTVTLKKRLDACLDLLSRTNLIPKSVEISTTAIIKSVLY